MKLGFLNRFIKHSYHANHEQLRPLILKIKKPRKYEAFLNLQCDQILIIGSTNWTNSSQNNQEISVAYAMNAEGLRAHTKRIEEMREGSEIFSEVEGRRSGCRASR